MAKKAPKNPVWAAVRATLNAAVDAEVAARYQSIAPSRSEILGISVPVLRGMVKEFAAAHKGLTVSEAVDMANLAFASGCREEMLFATFLVARFKTKLAREHWERLDRWIDSLDNWEACDQLAMGVAGEMVGRATGPQRAAWAGDLVAWAAAADPWRRRVAVATTTVLNQKGRSDASTALRVCAVVVADSDKSVRKAVGWALREACKSDAGAVFAWLSERKDTMPRTVLRESAAKLPASQRKLLGL